MAVEKALPSRGASILNRERAYCVLAQELERFRRLPRSDLVRYISGPVIEMTEWDGAEPLTIEIRVEWADEEAGVIRIRATSNGPSSWRLERLEEAVLLRPPAPEW
jgi:hypothetical protein